MVPVTAMLQTYWLQQGDAYHPVNGESFVDDSSKPVITGSGFLFLAFCWCWSETSGPPE